MSVFYYILWIPSFEISEPEILHKDLDLCKLQDVADEEPLFLKDIFKKILILQLTMGLTIRNVLNRCCSDFTKKTNMDFSLIV